MLTWTVTETAANVATDPACDLNLNCTSSATRAGAAAEGTEADSDIPYL